MEKQLISVIIPIYNKKKDIIRTLDSVYKQNYKYFEIIVVNDNSTDDSVKTIKKKFPETKIISLKENKGPAIARNIGIKKSKGEIIVGIDSDQIFVGKDNLKNIVLKFKKDKDVDVLVFRIINNYTKKDDKGAWWHPFPIKKFANKEFYTNYFGAGIVAFKRKVLEKSGLYPKEFFMVGEEDDLAFRILNNDFNILYFPKVKVMHYYNPYKTNKNDRRAYYQRRNQLWLAVKFYPFWKGLFYTIPRIIKGFFSSIKNGNLNLYLKGLYDGIKGIPKELKLRRPLKKETWKKIKLIKKGKYNHKVGQYPNSKI